MYVCIYIYIYIKYCICSIELGKACFTHDTVYDDSKDLAKKVISDKI